MQGNKKLNLRTSQAEKQVMTTDLANTTKADLAAEVDRLRAENTKLAARPCLACAVAPHLHVEVAAALESLLARSFDLLDKAAHHRAMARVPSNGRLEVVADERWQEHIELVDQLREEWAAVAQKQA